MWQGLDWLELLWRGIRTLFGYRDAKSSESLTTTADIAAAVLVVVLLLSAVFGALAVIAG